MKKQNLKPLLLIMVVAVIGISGYLAWKNIMVSIKSYQNEKYSFEVKFPNKYFASEISTDLVEIADKKWKDQDVNHPYVSIEVFRTDKSTVDWVSQKIQDLKNSGYGILERDCEMVCVSNEYENIEIGNEIQALKYSVWGTSGGGDYYVAKKTKETDWLIEIYVHTAGSREQGEESIPQNDLDKILSSFRFR